MTVVGARPQFVKAAAVSRAFARSRVSGKPLEEQIVHTGQHYDAAMSDVFFRELGIPEPQHHLNVGSGAHGFQTAEIMRRLEETVEHARPDLMLVYGDTNSTLAAALVAAKSCIPLAHVEAGLRSYNRTMPEEVNRVVTDHVSELLFCPSAVAKTNLAREGITTGVHVVGDVMFDVLRHTLGRIGLANPIADRLGCPSEYVLATIHRPANTDDPSRFADVVQMLAKVGADVPVIWPVHPRVANAVSGLWDRSELVLVPPATYEEMVALERGAAAIITDSGGVQKEALWLQVPCVTIRTETEWTETVELGWNRLMGENLDAVPAAVHVLGTSRPPEPPPVYGDGDAATKIIDALMERCDAA